MFVVLLNVAPTIPTNFFFLPPISCHVDSLERKFHYPRRCRTPHPPQRTTPVMIYLKPKMYLTGGVFGYVAYGRRSNFGQYRVFGSILCFNAPPTDYTLLGCFIFSFVSSMDRDGWILYNRQCSKISSECLFGKKTPPGRMSPGRGLSLFSTYFTADLSCGVEHPRSHC